MSGMDSVRMDTVDMMDLKDKDGNWETLQWFDLEPGEYYWVGSFQPAFLRSGVFQFQNPDWPQEKTGLQSVAMHTRYCEEDVERLLEGGAVIVHIKEPDFTKEE